MLEPSFSFDAARPSSFDPQCEFCEKHYIPHYHLDDTFGRPACLVGECPSVEWFLQKVGDPGLGKTLEDHEWVLEFEVEHDGGYPYNYHPVLRCVDPCTPQQLMARSMIELREDKLCLNGYKLCGCELAGEVFDNPEEWLTELQIKVQPKFTSYQTYEGDWDSDMWVEIVGQT